MVEGKPTVQIGDTIETTFESYFDRAGYYATCLWTVAGQSLYAFVMLNVGLLLPLLSDLHKIDRDVRPGFFAVILLNE